MSAIVALDFEVGGVVGCLGGAPAILLNLLTAPPLCAVTRLCGCGCGCGCFATLGCGVAVLAGCVMPMFWLNCEKLSLPDFPSV